MPTNQLLRPVEQRCSTHLKASRSDQQRVGRFPSRGLKTMTLKESNALNVGARDYGPYGGHLTVSPDYDLLKSILNEEVC